MSGFAVYETKIGNFKIEYEEGYVTALKKIVGEAEECPGEKNELTEKTYIQLIEYLDGKRKNFDIPFKLKGTDFMKKVWGELCNIPYGETRSYKDVACAIGDQNASRAVGSANNKNPLHLIVPCHRVVGSGGKLVGYAGGLPMKEFLLDMESRNK